MAPPVKITWSQLFEKELTYAVGDAKRSAVNKLQIKNEEQDVALVQSLLKEIAKTFPVQTDHGRSYSVNPGKVDGDCGSKTIRAIDNMQRWFFGGTVGRVGPDGRTLKFMRAILYGNYELHVRPAANTSLVSLLQGKMGQPYMYGAAVPKRNARWMGPWDCAEFVAWGLNLTCGSYLGDAVIGCRKVPGYHNAYTGYFVDDFAKLSKLPNPKNIKEKVAEEVDFEYATKHQGVIGVRKGHIYVSAGGGTTIEAAGTKKKRAVQQLSVRNKSKYRFWKVNLMRYL